MYISFEGMQCRRKNRLEFWQRRNIGVLVGGGSGYKGKYAERLLPLLQGVLIWHRSLLFEILSLRYIPKRRFTTHAKTVKKSRFIFVLT